MLPNGSDSPLFELIPSVLSVSDSPATIAGMLLVGTIAAVFFAIGKHDKPAALLMWYLLACLFGRNPLIANPALPYVGWMLLAHLFIPGAPWAAFAANGRMNATDEWHMPPSIYFAAWVVLGLSYSYSGYTKLLSPSWASGDTVWYVLQNPLARDHFVRELLLWLGQDVVRWITWTILWVELLFAPLVLFKSLRPILWGAMLIVQIGFLVLLNFADLTTPMLLFHLLTFDPAWIKPTASRTTETIYYDGHCGFCHGVVRFVLAEDRGAHFRFGPLQGSSFRNAVQEPLRDAISETFVIIDEQGQVLTKSDAAIHILGRLGGLWTLLGLALRIVPRTLRNFAYDCVGKIRHRLGEQPDAMCPILPAAQRARFRP
jgi:predicted DCC family thiol-disulfide oxidoreductase YuxK